MGNAFYRRDELDIVPALTQSIPMLSSVLGLLGNSKDNRTPKLAGILENMDPELIQALAHQVSMAIPGLEGLEGLLTKKE